MHFAFRTFLPPFELRRRKAVPVIDQKVTNERTGPLQVLMNDDGYYTPKFIFSLTHFLSFSLLRCFVPVVRRTEENRNWELRTENRELRVGPTVHISFHFISRQVRVHRLNCKCQCHSKRTVANDKREIWKKERKRWDWLSLMMMVMMPCLRVFQTRPISFRKKKEERSG